MVSSIVYKLMQIGFVIMLMLTEHLMMTQIPEMQSNHRMPDAMTDNTVSACTQKTHLPAKS